MEALGNASKSLRFLGSEIRTCSADPSKIHFFNNVFNSSIVFA
jgi:hypothetical protein